DVRLLERENKRITRCLAYRREGLETAEGAERWLRRYRLGCRNRRIDQRLDGRQSVDLPAEHKKVVHLTSRQCEHSLIPELVVELAIAQRPTKVSDRLLDEAAELASIGQLYFDVSLIFGDGVVSGRRGALPHAFDIGIIHCFVGILLDACLATNETNGRTVIDRKLTLQSARDVLLVAKIENQRCHAKPHTADGLRRGMMLVVNLNAGVDRRVVHDSARKWLVGVGAQIEVNAEPGGDLREVTLRGLYGGEPARTLDSAVTRREARPAKPSSSI